MSMHRFCFLLAAGLSLWSCGNNPAETEAHRQLLQTVGRWQTAYDSLAPFTRELGELHALLNQLDPDGNAGAAVIALENRHRHLLEQNHFLLNQMDAQIRKGEELIVRHAKGELKDEGLQEQLNAIRPVFKENLKASQKLLKEHRDLEKQAKQLLKKQRETQLQ